MLDKALWSVRFRFSGLLIEYRNYCFGFVVGRRAQKAAASKSGRGCKTVFPDMKDHEAVQRFFLQEIQLGEELLAAGDLENGVDHLGNAVAVCGQPNDLLQVKIRYLFCYSSRECSLKF